MKPSTILSFLALALPFSSAIPSHNKRHHEVANRARADVGIHKRGSFPNARLTYYDVGLGACGIWNKPGDFIVALNVEQFGPGFPGEYCFKTITIWINGATATATITDKCEGCPWGGLDLSRGLFDYFAPEAQGVIYASWWFDE
ncbi:RlpA-like double-psi beta-barrel-protein domain-containing protein-containing protein [Boletus edulis]|uniref:RlpA-like double-psi beta-barrel-protein domain-containing protein-containing protein n=1 Tax=Boletus edulis BED1 TaxID=1328754 RepID=A0AAD4BLB1_BOLED|nr:RlpA-like double-psi beta-barrel-protein domain-containing protein-containing protein [Boletus edulis]KAF8433905.1 RlpA-like double-psi beta-barrel-protein domain-containing protein-containing protein [Boletus edulis BED1]